MSSSGVTLLPLLYLGNLPYWACLYNCGDIALDDQEIYPKGTFRNRCQLLGSQGMMRLSIPLRSGKHAGQPYREVRTDEGRSWQRQHWQSIKTCYGRAPFFSHYAEKLESLFRQEFPSLWLWNLTLFRLIAGWLNLEMKEPFLLSQIVPSPIIFNDWRRAFSDRPQQRYSLPGFHSVPYPQVFGHAGDFNPAGSILDLLFCQGPYAGRILRRMAAP